MKKTTFLRIVLCATTLGCAGTSEVSSLAIDAPGQASTGDESSPLLADASELNALDQATESSIDSSLASLPQAPWAAPRISADADQAGLVEAWSQAENSSTCAPLSLSADAIGDAHARASSLAGGWAIEFDQRGAPGVRANGASCARCGRGAFGIAGTGMSPDEVFDLEDGADVTPTFSDGSMVELAAVEEGVASATLTVQGQGCVYQVWSFLGQDHLDALLAHLRFVRVDAPSDTAVASASDL
ncbi:MAG: hypothetical protein GXP55_06900 [Deltaproteobacteria bacterium]|nr:hypothetical protein [Deltaproteobacteria bacterium]